jgi:hypothetical protein
MKNKFSSGLLLCLYGAVTIATSVKPDAQYVTHSYSVSTNCSNASFTTGQISVTEGRIISPSVMSFYALGIPSETLNIGADISGELAPALTRTCLYTLDTSTPNVSVSVYTCDDNGIPACIVNLTHLD